MDTAAAIKIAGTKADEAQADIEFYTFCKDALVHSTDQRMLAFIDEALALAGKSAAQHTAIKHALADL